jgi:phosphoribosylformimino-5-aminoimidazole carboxamide ribonucleotide (ProFAR) isomerase
MNCTLKLVKLEFIKPKFVGAKQNAFVVVIRELFETIERLDRDGCSRYIVTDVARDGTLTGPNLELLKSVCATTNAPVVASGGVSSLADIAAIAELVEIGVEGSIVGKALYAGAFTLPEALAVANGK